MRGVLPSVWLTASPLLRPAVNSRHTTPPAPLPPPAPSPPSLPTPSAQVRIKCPHCSIILDLPAETTKFKCAKCTAVCNVTASQQATTPEDIFAKASKMEPIMAPPAAPSKGDTVQLEKLVGYLILEIRELRRRNVDDEAVKVDQAPKLEAAVAAKADLDGDGVITEDELREVYGTKEDPTTAKLRELAKQADFDGDGLVSDDELLIFARMAAVAKAADVDGDGNITEEELAARYGDTEVSRKYMMLTSTSADGDLEDVLSEDELKRIVARVQGHKTDVPEKHETDEEKARRMLAEHSKRQATMTNLLEVDKKKQEEEIQKQLLQRRRRKAALKRIANEKSLAEAGTDLAKVSLQKTVYKPQIVSEAGRRSASASAPKAVPSRVGQPDHPGGRGPESAVGTGECSFLHADSIFRLMLCFPLPQIEELLATLIAEAMQDGVIDEDEKREIDAAKAAIAKVTGLGVGATPG